MEIHNHLLLSAIVALWYAVFSLDFNLSNFLLVVIVFSSGFVLDLDHFLDLYINYRRVWFSQKKIMSMHRAGIKLYVVLHTYEINVVFFLLYAYYTNLIFLWMALNFTLHLITDTFTNEVHYPAYSIIWRISKRFDCEKIHYERSEAA